MVADIQDVWVCPNGCGNRVVGVRVDGKLVPPASDCECGGRNKGWMNCPNHDEALCGKYGVVMCAQTKEWLASSLALA